MKQKVILVIVAILSIILVGVVSIISSKQNKAEDSSYSKIDTSIDNSSSQVDSSFNVDTSSQVGSSSEEDSSSEVDSSSQTDTPSNTDDEVAQTMASFSDLSYYKDENAERYVAYKMLNENIPYKECIVNVNVGLDRQFYTNIYLAKDPSALDVLVNKYSALTVDFVPPNLVNIPAEFDNRGGSSQLRDVAKDAFVSLCTDAKAKGFVIKGQSAYRSGSYQNSLYNNYVAADGKAAADTYSARPGHSEHQTGLAIDVIGDQYGTIGNFYKEDEYPYVQENAHKYGFIIRYPIGDTNITGYQSEPWHLRYVGVEIATQVYNEKITFDEYYALYR